MAADRGRPRAATVGATTAAAVAAAAAATAAAAGRPRVRARVPCGVVHRPPPRLRQERRQRLQRRWQPPPPAERVGASPARRPTRRQPRRLPPHTGPTPHHRAPSHPDRLPMINVHTENTQLFLQSLHPATPMLRRGPPPPRSSRPRATVTAATARAATRSATTQPPIRTFERKTLSQASEATFSASPKNLRECDHIRPRQPALTTPQTSHLPSRTFLTTICSRRPYGRRRRCHLEQTRTMVGRTCALLSIVKRRTGDVAGQRRTQKGPPGTVFVKYSHNVHWKRQLILRRAGVYLWIHGENCKKTHCKVAEPPHGQPQSPPLGDAARQCSRLPSQPPPPLSVRHQFLATGL